MKKQDEWKPMFKPGERMLYRLLSWIEPMLTVVVLYAFATILFFVLAVVITVVANALGTSLCK